MIKNYIRIAWRNLMKHKGFSFINIFGLAVGLTCCMLISLYIYHEKSYDSFHEKKDRLFHLVALNIGEGKENYSAAVSAPLSENLKMEFPEIEETARLLKAFEDDKTLIQYNEGGELKKSFYENRGYIADETFFKLLSYNFTEGDPETALSNSNTVVISEEIAGKLFGNQSAINKVIKISSSTNGDHDFQITGVFKPSPVPSHIDARFFMSAKGGNMEELFLRSTSMVNNNMFHTYLLLNKDADPRKLETKFDAFIEQYMGAALRERGNEKKLFLTNVEDIHLESKIDNTVTPAGSNTYLKILASIAILTLLIACINFMNLSTSRSSKRSLEVGVRKVLGAEKNSLIGQFLGESIILALIAFLFASLATYLLLPMFESISGKEITLTFQQHGMLLAIFVVLSFVTGLLAGSYPAFYLSSFKPVKVLKGRFSNTLAATSLRKGMVIFQFVISIALIIGSVIISNQMSFLRSAELGFQKDQQIVIPLRSSVAKEGYAALKDNLERDPNIKSVGASFYYPGIFNPMDWLMYKEGYSMQDAKSVYINFVDDSFLQTLDIKPVAGRMFSAQFPADTNNNMVINEKTISELGFASAEDAIGQWVAFDWEGSPYRFTIIGVVKDFHFKDLHNPIEPFGFLLNSNSNFNYIIAHVKDSDPGSVIKSLDQSWTSLFPDEPFEYSFLDQDFQNNYQAEERLSSIILNFTFITIIISCLGLFGLANFSFEQRIKEIGIRKVLGASVTNLVTLLSADFIKLIVVAIILAIPISWYIMNEWLESFTYRVDITWQVFGFTAFLAILIALLTISFQAIKTAMINPVNNLRAE